MKAKSSLSPLELEFQRRKHSLLIAKNKAVQMRSFGKIKTLKEIYEQSGRVINNNSSERNFLDREISVKEVKELFSRWETELQKEYDDNKATSREAGKDDNGTKINGEETNNTPHKIPDTIPRFGFSNYSEKPPKQNCELLYFQGPAAKTILDKLFFENRRAVLLIGNAGIGKTFILGSVLRHIIDIKYTDDKTFSPWPICYITRASVVEQTKRVMEREFGLSPVTEIEITNIDQMRSSFGDMMVRYDTKIQDGEAIVTPVWKPRVYPIIMIVDECQAVKNEASIQSQIFQAYNEIPDENIRMIFLSATPFTRVSEAKVFCVATRAEVLIGGKKQRLTNKNWPQYAQAIASDYGRSDVKPEDHSPAAIERLIADFLPYIVDVKGVQSKFHARNKVELIDFSSAAEEEEYSLAYETWLRQKQKIEDAGSQGLSGSSGMDFLVALLKFRMAAERIRTPILARRAYEKLQKGYSPVIAACFKQTISKVVSHLVYDYNIPRNDISLIWGGGKTVLSQKKKKAISISKNTRVMDTLAELGMDLEDFGLDETVVEQGPLDLALRLGSQSLRERQREIDRFQEGRSKVCLFSFKSGGVGLSLHHDNPNGKPRSVDVTPTYSAIELVQGLGRCPRITSLSDTEQTLLFYRGTVEERVALRVSQKLKCLKKVVRTKESWEQVIYEATYSKDRDSHTYIKSIAEELQTVPTDDEDALMSGESGEDNDSEEQI